MFLPIKNLYKFIFIKKRSFGVLLFEIFSIGRQPYPGNFNLWFFCFQKVIFIKWGYIFKGMDNKQVINFIKNSGVPQIPDKCPTSM